MLDAEPNLGMLSFLPEQCNYFRTYMCFFVFRFEFGFLSQVYLAYFLKFSREEDKVLYLDFFFFNWMELLSDSASFPVCMKWARPPKRKSNIYIYYFLGSVLILKLSVCSFWAAAVVESLLPNRIGIEIPVHWNIWLKRDVIENKYML